MLTLVVGGAASGKSAYAERLILRSGAPRRVYLATMEPSGAEAAARIARHRVLRAGKGFETIECYVNLLQVEVPPDSAVLLEDMGNLCANELFSPRGAGQIMRHGMVQSAGQYRERGEIQSAAEAILAGVMRLRARCRELVIVSNEVFAGGADYAGDTLRYLSELSYVNRKLAEAADAVCEVSCGTAEYYKGEEA